MKAGSKAALTEGSRAYRAILLAGLSAGVLDLMAALVNAGLQGATPVRVLQYIASGLLGPDSFRGGFGTALLGAGLHFLIAYVAAAVYYGASRRIDFLVKRAVVGGPLYGIAVYFFMNSIVLPLSAVRQAPFSFSSFVTGLVIHMLFVGLPISLVVGRFAK